MVLSDYNSNSTNTSFLVITSGQTYMFIWVKASLHVHLPHYFCYPYMFIWYTSAYTFETFPKWWNPTRSFSLHPLSGNKSKQSNLLQLHLISPSADILKHTYSSNKYKFHKKNKYSQDHFSSARSNLWHQHFIDF